MLGVTHKVRIRLGRIDVIRKDADGWISAVSLSPFKIRYSSWSLRHGRGFTALVRENYRERGLPQALKRFNPPQVFRAFLFCPTRLKRGLTWRHVLFAALNWKPF
jgi:hypothetical protein